MSSPAPKAPETKIAYIEQNMGDVMKFFMGGFKLTEGVIARSEWFIDQHKNKVIIKIWVQDKPDVPRIFTGES